MCLRKLALGEKRGSVSSEKVQAMHVQRKKGKAKKTGGCRENEMSFTRNLRFTAGHIGLLISN
jgi:hypothetical protein